MQGMKDIALLLICFLLCFATAALGGYFNTFGLGQWYDSLQKPSFNPPGWIFGPVWTVLYVMMAISLWRVWRKGGEVNVRKAVVLFLLHLLLNAAWSGIFFALHRPGWAFVEILVLWVFIVTIILVFRPIDTVAAYLLIPYLLWVSFATILNANLWWLNK